MVAVIKESEAGKGGAIQLDPEQAFNGYAYPLGLDPVSYSSGLTDVLGLKWRVRYK